MFNQHTRYTRFIAFDFLNNCGSNNVNLIIFLYVFNCAGRSAELISSMHQMHFRANPTKIYCFFKSCITAAEHNNLLVFVKKSITSSTSAYTSTPKLIFSLKICSFWATTSAKNYCFCFINTSIGLMNVKNIIFLCDLADFTHFMS